KHYTDLNEFFCLKCINIIKVMLYYFYNIIYIFCIHHIVVGAKQQYFAINTCTSAKNHTKITRE
ncbi:hypothetical protein BpHYR1_024784, partial [Brachionus plicatilis]